MVIIEKGAFDLALELDMDQAAWMAKDAGETRPSTPTVSFLRWQFRLALCCQIKSPPYFVSDEGTRGS